MSYYDWEHVFGDQKDKKSCLHGKIIQFNTEQGTYLLIGSANATKNALGSLSSYSNDEACILIYTTKHDNYLKSLNVNIDQKKKITSDAVENWIPNKNVLCKLNSKVVLEYAELNENTLNIGVNQNGIFCLSILDERGESLYKDKIVVSKGHAICKKDNFENAVLCVLQKEGEEISNRCMIVKEEDIIRCNPNPALRKLEVLLDQSTWDVNLEKILSYVFSSAETSLSENATTFKQKKKNSLDTNGITISKDDFDNLSIDGKQTIYGSPSNKILEFLSSLLRGKGHHYSNDSINDEVSSCLNIDDSNSEYANNIEEEKKKRTDLMLAVKKYSQVFQKYLYDKLEDFYNENKSSIQNPIGKIAAPSQIDASIFEFSKMLISSALTWKLILDEKNDENKNLFDECVEYYFYNLGMFLLYVRSGYTKSDTYAYNKKVEYHKDLIVFSLLIVAVIKLKKEQYQEIQVLLLNLLDSYYEIHKDIDEIFSHYEEKMSKDNVLGNALSRTLISEAFDIYKKFARHKKNGTLTQLKSVINKYDDLNDIAYKSKVGFVCIYDYEQTNMSGVYHMWNHGLWEEMFVGGSSYLKISSLSTLFLSN